MDRMLDVDLQMEALEGGLRELVLRWFRETQEQLILHNGNFPDWFRGFVTRRDAEDQLRDQTLGCFLIRLSDKVLGYILSYKGLDRCRHFVINQNKAGHFVIAGDPQTHHSLTDLILHYKASPIQPFGEYLTSCSDQNNQSELYDVVKVESQEKSVLSVQALKSLWDQKNDQSGDRKTTRKAKQQTALPTVQPPALPPKSRTRKLTGTVSVDTMSLSQVPPVPRRGIPLSHSLSGSFPTDKSAQHSQIQPNFMDQENVERPRASMLLNPVEKDSEIIAENLSSLNSIDSGSTDSLMEDRSTSVVRRDANMEEAYTNRLDPLCSASPKSDSAALKTVTCQTYSLHVPRGSMRDDANMEEAYTNRLNPMCSTPPKSDSAALKTVTCQTYSLHVPRGGLRETTTLDDVQTEQLDSLKSNPLYQASECCGETPAQREDSVYAEVPAGPTLPGHRPIENDYELISAACPAQSNTYETLEDVKGKQPKSTLGKSNIKWRKFLPEYKKK